MDLPLNNLQGLMSYKAKTKPNQTKPQINHSFDNVIYCKKKKKNWLTQEWIQADKEDKQIL